MRRSVVLTSLVVGFGLIGLGTAGATAVQSDMIQCLTLPAIFLPENGPPGSEFVPAFCPNPANPSVAVVLLEPGTTTVSDQLWSQGGMFFFASDPDLVDLGPNGLNIPTIFPIEETGTAQDLSAFFGLPPNYIVVTSDVTNDTDIPEPGTFLFAGTALVLVGIRKLRPR
jgi:hypothetical protein